MNNPLHSKLNYINKTNMLIHCGLSEHCDRQCDNCAFKSEVNYVKWLWEIYAISTCKLLLLICYFKGLYFFKSVNKNVLKCYSGAIDFFVKTLKIKTTV